MIISNLAVLLAERKMKVADLVRSTGINKSTLHKLYNGESVRIDFETIDKICLALDVEVGDLLVLKKNDKELADFLLDEKAKKFLEGNIIDEDGLNIKKENDSLNNINIELEEMTTEKYDIMVS